MTDLPEGEGFAELPIVTHHSHESGVPFEPKWHHIATALLDLPDAEYRAYVKRLTLMEDTDPRIPDVLDALSGHDSLRPSPQAIFRSVLERTDTAPGGYVRPRDIVTDLGRAGFQFEWFRMNTDQVAGAARDVVAGNLISERGIGRSYRLINPANARMFRDRTVVLPEEIIDAEQILQLAYLAFRLVVPHPDGSGIIRKSEVATALHANFGSSLPKLAHQVTGRFDQVLGYDSIPESIARVATDRLGEHSLFEVSSLRQAQGPDRWIRLKSSALSVES